MKRHRLTLSALLLIFSPLSQATEEVNLAQKMASLQYLTHKTALAIDHQNSKLADFYIYELNSSVKKLLEVDLDHGIPVGLLVKTTLSPTLKDLEQTAALSDWKASSSALDNLIQSCNECHQISDHDFIVIERRQDNPYLQSFAPQ